jgi:hypothetical protein
MSPDGQALGSLRLPSPLFGYKFPVTLLAGRVVVLPVVLVAPRDADTGERQHAAVGTLTHGLPDEVTPLFKTAPYHEMSWVCISGHHR